jgi:mannosyl-oligosaccharide alpha-1,2-mannosidase
MFRRFTFPHSRSLRILPQQARIRYLILAIIALVLFFSFSSDKLPAGNGPYRIQASFPAESAAAKSVRLHRRERVKDAFRHAWKGYKEHAWLHDEVMPLSGGNKDPFVGWAATLVDGLDTLFIMGMKDEFEDALKALERIDFSKPNTEAVPIFEATIRYLGGLLGAWDISGHKYPILLEKAQQLGDFLYRAFDTESGIPVPYYRWQNHGAGKLAGENGVLVAQIGSLSLEFIRLSQVTGDAKYAGAVQKITDQLEQTQNKTALPGMWPSQADCEGPTLSFSSVAFTLGAFAGEFPSSCLISITNGLTC